MAKTLFFIEALALCLIALAFPLIASEATAAFLIPMAISLILPLACAAAVWPPRAVFAALRAAFSSRRLGHEAAESARVLESLAYFSRAAAILGFLFSVTALCVRLPIDRSLETWTLLGAFLSAYALINVQLWRILAAVIVGQGEEGPSALQAPDALSEAFAARFGLSPREAETASRIAAGMSYKETAHELGISIRTVKAHMGRVYEKTGAASNVALAILVKDEGGRPA